MTRRKQASTPSFNDRYHKMSLVKDREEKQTENAQIITEAAKQMSNHLFALAIPLALVLSACDPASPPAAQTGCDQATLAHLEQQLGTGDGEGHGPDIGSDEWHSVVEFKLNLRGNNDLPARHTQAWCQYMSDHLP